MGPKDRERMISKASGRGLGLGRAGGWHGERVTCWEGKLCASMKRAALVDGPIFHYSEPTTGQRERRRVVAESGGWQAG